LHGGTLHNPVIFHSDRELHRVGMTTLRFNSRGTGESEGTHDDGRGEIEDIAAAVAWLRGLAPGVPMLLVGFSFGAVCSIGYAIRDANIRGVIALGLPVDKYPFDELPLLKRPLFVVQAENDEFGTPDRVRQRTEGMQPAATIRVIENTTHLFPERARDAASAVVDSAETLLSDR
ncbi:MAG: alpha/beta hydrolase, partial [Acidobacteriota bacterium]|nr:alpha/beta hydrolase [Acidobacteriota bacterium]